MTGPRTERWRLAIDFGTVFTTAAIFRTGRSELVDVEGDGTFRVHSGVLLQASGSLAVGSVARHEAAFAPDRYEATPKRSIGDSAVLLGDRMVSVTDIVAAFYVRVISEAKRISGGVAPDEVYLTHPADWATTRINVLTEAARAAGLHEVVLVPEPVAAAVHIGAATAEIGRHVAIYDLGGGTYDAAVLLRTRAGYEVAGPPGGKDPLGGADIDQRIIDHLGRGELGQSPDWANLMDPPDMRWRQASVSFREAVRKAKEGLSTTLAWQLWVPGLERDVQLTRAELEALIKADIDETVDITERTIAAAGVTTADLAGIYLVGGSSRIPLIAQTIWQRFGIQPHTYDDPKAVVVLGAVEYAGQVPAGVKASATMVFTFAPPGQQTLEQTVPSYAPGQFTPSPQAPTVVPGPPPPPGPLQFAPPRQAQAPGAYVPPAPPQYAPAPFAPPAQAYAPPPPYQPAAPPPPLPPQQPWPAPRPPDRPIGAPAAAHRPRGGTGSVFQTTQGRSLAALAAVLVIAAVAVVILTTRSGSSGSSTSSIGGGGQPLSDTTLQTLVPTAAEIGTEFSDSGVKETLNDLRLCGQSPNVVGLLGEATTVASSSTQAVVVDVAQFQSGHASTFITSEQGVLPSCNSSWIDTDPKSGQRVVVSGMDQTGTQFGDQTYRVLVSFNGQGGATVQYIVLARTGDVLVTVVVQGPTADSSRADSIVSATLDKVHRAGG